MSAQESRIFHGSYLKQMHDSRNLCEKRLHFRVFYEPYYPSRLKDALTRALSPLLVALVINFAVFLQSPDSSPGEIVFPSVLNII